MKYRGKCEPTFLLLAGGELVAVVRGANGHLLQKTIIEQLAAEKKVLSQGSERHVIKDEAILEDEDEIVPVQAQTEDEELVPAGKSYTVAIIKPDAVAHGKTDEIIMKIQESGFDILANEERTMTESEAREFYQHREGEEKFQELIQFMSSGPCHVLIISKSDEDEDVIPAWREFIGPTDVEIAKKEKPESLRAQYGTEVLYNAVHGSNDREQASRELAFFFPNFKISNESPKDLTSVRPERTLALIRPDILKDKKDEILQSIQIPTWPGPRIPGGLAATTSHTSHNLRSNGSNNLTIPRVQLKTFGSRAFCHAAPTLWNALPNGIKTAPTMDTFKSKLKSHLFSLAFMST
ncbi:hypothetical protein XENTR_v10017669 [Xenopus tropicalis]|nr:hypothetical protein XENTR_v10017669 [Xenopus tropicalis]